MLIGACSNGMAANAPLLTTYRCVDGRTFTVQRGEETAEVGYFNERYRLPRRPSRLGIRYATEDATLIIDGDFAAFVTEHVVDLESCTAQH